MIALERLLLTGLELLYDAHHQGAKQSAADGDASTYPKLKLAAKLGSRVNLAQAKRLEKVFQTLGTEPDREPDAGMRGILEAQQKRLAQPLTPTERDLLHIASGQTAAHYFLAQYGTLRTYAEQLGNKKAASLLQKTLDETAKADKKLTELALEILAKAGGKKQSSSGILTWALTLGALALALSGTKITASFSLDAGPEPEKP